MEPISTEMASNAALLLANFAIYLPEKDKEMLIGIINCFLATIPMDEKDTEATEARIELLLGTCKMIEQAQE